jgi:hypothetical protein
MEGASLKCPSAFPSDWPQERPGAIPQPASDFGWRLYRRTIRVLPNCPGVPLLPAPQPYGFFLCREWFRHPHGVYREGVFLAGYATVLNPIRYCMVDGAAMAARVAAVVCDASPLRFGSSSSRLAPITHEVEYTLRGRDTRFTFINSKENL